MDEDWHAVYQASCKGVEGEEREKLGHTSMWKWAGRSAFANQGPVARPRPCGGNVMFLSFILTIDPGVEHVTHHIIFIHIASHFYDACLADVLRSKCVRKVCAPYPQGSGVVISIHSALLSRRAREKQIGVAELRESS